MARAFGGKIELDNEASATLKAIKGDVKDMGNVIQGVFGASSTQFGVFGRALDSAAHLIPGFNAAMLKSAAISGAVAAGMVMAAKAVFSAADAGAEFAVKIADLAAKAGVTTDELQRLSSMTERFGGVSAATITRAKDWTAAQSELSDGVDVLKTRLFDFVDGPMLVLIKGLSDLVGFADRLSAKFGSIGQSVGLMSTLVPLLGPLAPVVAGGAAAMDALAGSTDEAAAASERYVSADEKAKRLIESKKKMDEVLAATLKKHNEAKREQERIEEQSRTVVKAWLVEHVGLVKQAEDEISATEKQAEADRAAFKAAEQAAATKRFGDFTAMRLRQIQATSDAQVLMARAIDAEEQVHYQNARARAEAAMAVAVQAGETMAEVIGIVADTHKSGEEKVRGALKATLKSMHQSAVAYIYAQAAQASAKAWKDAIEKFGLAGIIIGAGAAALAFTGISLLINKLNDGGFVGAGAGQPGRDSVPAMLTPGEYVMSTPEVEGMRKFMGRMGAGGAGDGGGAVTVNVSVSTLDGSMPSDATLTRLAQSIGSKMQELRRRNMLVTA